MNKIKKLVAKIHGYIKSLKKNEKKEESFAKKEISEVRTITPTIVFEEENKTLEPTIVFEEVKTVAPTIIFKEIDHTGTSEPAKPKKKATKKKAVTKGPRTNKKNK